MRLYWKVRIYNDSGQYGIGQLETGEGLTEINSIQNFYKALTGNKMLLEGMSLLRSDIPSIGERFKILFPQGNKNGQD